MLGALISAGASLAGGLLGMRAQNKANKANEQMQRDAATQGVQWRVADAEKAGVSPLVALGMSPISMSPSHVGDTALPSALQSMGQDVGRAVAATSTSQSKFDASVRALTLEKLGLENQLLGSQIRRMNAPGMVSAPGTASVIDGQGDVPLLSPAGFPFETRVSRTGSKVEDVAPYIGDEPAEWLHGVPKWLRMRFPGWYKLMDKKVTPPAYSSNDHVQWW